MHVPRRRPDVRRWRRWRRAWGIGALACTGAGACSVSGSIGGDTAAGTAGTGGGLTVTSSSSTTSTGSISAPVPFDKIDILLAFDNTRSMAEKQQILADALVELTHTLADPPCLDPGGQAVAGQPSGPFDACPQGSSRQFTPIVDIHVGVVTSSLGGHGSDACLAPDSTSCPGGAINTSVNDHGHLISRADPCGTAVVPTYAQKGFLAWDPLQRDVPPGATNLTDFSVGAQMLATGPGDVGCVYPSQLESWYRFLVDPDPYQSITVSAGEVVRSGLDAILVAQRQNFLRSDSLLAILMLSDQDDCSVTEAGASYQATQLHDPGAPSLPFHLPRARAECAKDPADPCCLPCTSTPMGCPVDPACAVSPTLDAQSDGYGLRCWDQKRRFGADFLYPTDRYVQGLTLPSVPNRAGEMVLNPIFSQLDPKSLASVRDPSLVLLAGVVGVPWQDVARDPTDLRLGFKSAEELGVDAGFTTWDVILGDPDAGTPPLDPHMIASTDPRSGADPITGTALAPPGSPSGADPISGHEYAQATPNDLQYACVFPLRKALDCSVPGVRACDCTDPQNDSPLCEPDPTKNDQRTLQVRAKAYPALRQLRVLHDLGSQGVVASICAAQENDPSQLDYGYRPAIRALVERVSRRANLP